MHTVLDILRLSKQSLEDRGVASPRHSAEELLSECLDLERMDLYMNYDRPIQEAELSRFRSLLLRRLNGEPLAHIREHVEFFGVSIEVGPEVLIPRPETEILVDHIVKAIEPGEGVLWDVCTGSGCIGIALAKRFPNLRVILSDVSESALKIAKENAMRNDVNVEVRCGDLFECFEGESCDFFVANPPYVTEAEYINLDPEVRDFEPKTALVGGPTGLEYYEAIASGLTQHLRKGGRGFLELGTGQGPSVREIFCMKGFAARFEKDWSSHDRFFFIENE